MKQYQFIYQSFLLITPTFLNTNKKGRDVNIDIDRTNDCCMATISTGNGVHFRHRRGSSSEKRDIKLTTHITSKHLNLGDREKLCIRKANSLEHLYNQIQPSSEATLKSIMNNCYTYMALKHAPMSPPKQPTTMKRDSSHTE